MAGHGLPGYRPELPSSVSLLAFSGQHPIHPRAMPFGLGFLSVVEFDGALVLVAFCALVGFPKAGFGFVAVLDSLDGAHFGLFDSLGSFVGVDFPGCFVGR